MTIVPPPPYPRHEGAYFSSGHDLRDLFDKNSNWATRPPEQLERVFRACSELNIKLTELAQPTIAVVQGHASAGGIQLVASCDIVFATDSAEFSAPGSQRGRFCHTPGVAIANKIGSHKALELLLLGSTWSAKEAQRAGLVNFVVSHEQLEDKVMEIAQRLASASMNVYAGKEGFREQQALQGNIREQYRAAERRMTQTFSTLDACEGTRAMFEKRKPVWSVK